MLWIDDRAHHFVMQSQKLLEVLRNERVRAPLSSFLKVSLYNFISENGAEIARSHH